MRGIVQPGLRLIRRHLRAYLLLNVAFFGLVAAGMAYTFVNPDPQRQLTGSILESFDTPPLSFARDAYLSGNVGAAALITFLVNTIFGSFIALTLPSLLIPFAGTFLGFYRALLWGVIFAPTTPELARTMGPHFLTMLLEGEGYILVMFGVHLLWTSALDGARSGLSGFLAGYRAGLVRNLWVYVLVALVLAVAAVYEAIELIYIVARS